MPLFLISLHRCILNSLRLSSLINHNPSHRTNSLRLLFIPMTATTVTTQTTTTVFREELHHRRTTRPSWADISNRRVPTQPTGHQGTWVLHRNLATTWSRRMRHSKDWPSGGTPTRRWWRSHMQKIHSISAGRGPSGSCCFPHFFSLDTLLPFSTSL